MKTTSFLRRGLSAMTAALLVHGNATATDYVVDSTGDSVTQDGSVTLREALQAANTNAPAGDAVAGEADGDTISFDPTIFTLTPAITLSGTPYSISDDVSIDGTISDLTNVSISGAELSRIFNINSSGAPGSSNAVSLFNLDFSEGLTDSSGGALIVASGSDVSLEGVTIENSSASGEQSNQGGGAIFNQGTLSITGGSLNSNTATDGAGSGGAIFNGNNASLSVEGTSFDGNAAARAGGAIESRAGSSTVLNNVSMTTNTAGPNPGNGGGLHITGNGDATISGGSFTGNTASAEGGALWNGSGTLTVSEASFSTNAANGDAADDGGGAIFNNGGGLQVSNATISQNLATGTAGSGGGIFNADGGELTITGGSISENTASRAGGGIEDASGAATTIVLSGVTLDANEAGSNPGNGGALHITGAGDATLSGVTVTNNTAALEGGGLWNGSGTMTVDGTDSAVSIDANTASGAAADDGGGGLFNNGGALVVLGDVTISNNIADGEAGSGGGIFSLGGSADISDAVISDNRANRAGGGIETAMEHDLSLDGVTLMNNNAGLEPAVAAPGNGGALHVSGTGSVTVTGGSVAMNVAAAEGGGLWNQSGTTMTLNGVTVSQNDAQGGEASQGGGGLFNNGGDLVIDASLVSANSATTGSGSGGGLLNAGGSVSIEGSEFVGNMSARAGGAIEDRSVESPTTISILAASLRDNTTGSNPGNGGGLHISGGNSSVTVDRSEVVNNTASNEGGGLWNFDGSNLVVVNSTVSGNFADGTGGGGLFNRASGVLDILHSTVADNSASAGAGGGLLTADGGLSTASNSLFGDNSASSDADVGGALTNNTSLIETSDGDLGLDELAFNGGPTRTHALQAGSPAIDTADNLICQAAPSNGVDQRGVVRDDNCDIGAFEMVDGPVPTLSSNGSSATTTVVAGSTDVAALAFTIRSGPNEGIDVDGFSGLLEGTAVPSSAIARTKVYLDSDADGEIDPGEPELTSGNGATVSLSASQFNVSFDPARSIAADSSESYLVTVDISSDAKLVMTLAGLGLLPLLLAAPGGLRRLGGTTRAGLLVLIATLWLAGCSNSSNSNQASNLQFTLTDVDGTGQSSDQPVADNGQTVEGPVIVIE